MSQTLDCTEIRVTATCNSSESFKQELTSRPLKDHCQTSLSIPVLCHESCEEVSHINTLMCFSFSLEKTSLNHHAATSSEI